MPVYGRPAATPSPPCGPRPHSTEGRQEMNLSKMSPLLVVGFGIIACSGSSSDTMPVAPTTDDAQIPPTTGAADIEVWLAKGDYKKWHCEATQHPPKAPPSVHGQNRICSNNLTSQFAGKVTDERPKGSAAVKELWD